MPNFGHLPIFCAHPGHQFYFCPVSMPYYTKMLPPFFQHNLVSWDKKTIWFDWPQRIPMEKTLRLDRQIFRKPQVLSGFFTVGIAAPVAVLSQGKQIGLDALAGAPWHTFCFLEVTQPPSVGTRGCPWYLLKSTPTGFSVVDALEHPPYPAEHETGLRHALQLTINNPPLLQRMMPIPTMEQVQELYQIPHYDISGFDTKISNS